MYSLIVIKAALLLAVPAFCQAAAGGPNPAGNAHTRTEQFNYVLGTQTEFDKAAVDYLDKLPAPNAK